VSSWRWWTRTPSTAVSAIFRSCPPSSSVTWGMYCARRAVTGSRTSAGAMCAVAAPPVASAGATPWKAWWSPPASRARTRPTAARPAGPPPAVPARALAVPRRRLQFRRRPDGGAPGPPRRRRRPRVAVLRQGQDLRDVEPHPPQGRLQLGPRASTTTMAGPTGSACS